MYIYTYIYIYKVRLHSPSCTFAAYHALKSKVRGQLISMQELVDANFKNAWSLIADVLVAEAGECNLTFRAFSLAKFVCFLIDPEGYKNRNQILTAQCSAGDHGNPSVSTDNNSTPTGVNANSVHCNHMHVDTYI